MSNRIIHRDLPYCLNTKNEVSAEVRRAADEQLCKALDELLDDRLSTGDKVHQVRKRLKKTRALLRLVRPVFEASYAQENVYFRDAGRLLSESRDADVRVQTIQALEPDIALERAVVAAALRSSRHSRRRSAVVAKTRFEEVRSRLQVGVERVKDWRISKDGFDALADGLKKTYRRARKARHAAYASGEPELFHDWRKRVKYHRYHVRLLRAAWPKVFGARRDELKRLSDLLGDDHDLTMLAESAEVFADELDQDRYGTLIELTCRKQRTLRGQAEPLGTKLFTEKPKRYVRRVSGIWGSYSRSA